MWSHGRIRTILQKADAHHQLMHLQQTVVNGKDTWLNGYEYGLFMTPNDATVMGETLHVNGLILEDVVNCSYIELAVRRGYKENVECMDRIVWNVQVLRGLLKRKDAYKLLMLRYGLNGYEYALMHDEHLSREIGKLIVEKDITIRSVVRYRVFLKLQSQNIKALFLL